MRRASNRPRPAAAVLLALLAGGVAVRPVAVAAEVPSPTGEGPVARRPFIQATAFDLAKVGYEEAEYFISGTATAYTSATPLSADGKWSVTPGTTAPYKTRIVVYRPTDPKKFNGTVVVEWLN